MPIVNIQLVVAEDEERYAPAIVQGLADSLGEVFDADAGTTWIKMMYLDRRDYAENQARIPETVRPTFVEVLRRSLPEEDRRASEAQRIAAAVARVLSRPSENVHVIYLPAGAGRVAFGGNLVREQTAGK